ncbi:GNAT family N-acetyltransferase [Rhodoligotrophos defluvii]|uniref:GNAT family N-acetyltransferase n=1 Tax=Rhodoligotrophos defluvii TaxID=2561934 RepID=UPI0010C9D463|nr:GNAT family N-acetyltransferase [Rhodoligotrophos defluvii]
MAIRHTIAPDDDVRALLAELDAHLQRFYAPDQRHAVSLAELFQPNIAFFLAYAGGEPVACGGVGFYDGYAELKRLYSRPSARGRGYARSILTHLEEEACARGERLLRLETGVHQPEAIRFYERAGFRPCRPFGPYAAMPAKAIALSLFFEKPLAAGEA